MALLRCVIVSSSCFGVSVFLYFFLSVFVCLLGVDCFDLFVSLFLCFVVSLLLCVSAYLLICFSASLPRPFCRYFCFCLFSFVLVCVCLCVYFFVCLFVSACFCWFRLLV